MTVSALRTGVTYRYNPKSDKVTLLPWWIILPFVSMFFAFLAMPFINRRFGLIKLFSLGEKDWISVFGVVLVELILILMVTRMLIKFYSVSGTYRVENEFLVVKRMFGPTSYPVSTLQHEKSNVEISDIFGECEVYSLDKKKIRIDPRYMVEVQ